jgi:serine/threonine protein kinase
LVRLSTIHFPAKNIFLIFLGIVCIEILTQDTPYPDENDLNSFVPRFLNKEIKPMDFVPTHIPEKLQNLLQQIFSDNPTHRPSFDLISLCIDDIIAQNQ